MNLKELQAFISVYENQSISKAAERLYITQPSLTRTIQNIETQVGTQLFKRTREGLKPTVAGNIYMETAMRMIEMYRELELKLSLASSDSIGRITVGTNFFLGSCVLPEVVAEFEKKYKNIEITIVEGISSEIENEIIKGIVDIGITHMPVQSPSLNYKRLGQERFLIALPKGDPLSLRAYTKESNIPYLDISLLKSRKFILNHPNQRARQETERICKMAGFTPNVKYQMRNIQTVSIMVAKNIGVSLVPSSYINQFNSKDQPEYFNIEEKYNPQWPIAISYAKNLTMSPSIISFIEICQDILPKYYNY